MQHCMQVDVTCLSIAYDIAQLCNVFWQTRAHSVYWRIIENICAKMICIKRAIIPVKPSHFCDSFLTLSQLFFSLSRFVLGNFPVCTRHFNNNNKDIWVTVLLHTEKNYLTMTNCTHNWCQLSILTVEFYFQ